MYIGEINGEQVFSIKKESPNEGTETAYCFTYSAGVLNPIKKESPNEGTETSLIFLNQ